MHAFALLLTLVGSSFARPQFPASPVSLSPTIHTSLFSPTPHFTTSHPSLEAHGTIQASPTFHASPAIETSVHPSFVHTSAPTTAIASPVHAPEVPAACPNPVRATPSPASPVSPSPRVSPTSASPSAVTVTVQAPCPAAPAPATVTVTESCPAASVHASFPSVAATSPHVSSFVSHPAGIPGFGQTFPTLMELLDVDSVDHRSGTAGQGS
ncbi:hypothetical protein PVAR5_2022 [Paecilomyces variotii No. 5]|uniref:Uncharacterized protein n=1 Tax=Byssochlamys spectabilis (strain No. 5 / NBRC 109023) TaxID=1356009 RepID=V5FXS0_BYSSN|nr:hypothetical protein PVAR5_2022 [Paecilomyces variotii No. 5]